MLIGADLSKLFYTRFCPSIFHVTIKASSTNCVLLGESRNHVVHTNDNKFTAFPISCFILLVLYAEL